EGLARRKSRRREHSQTLGNRGAEVTAHIGVIPSGKGLLASRVGRGIARERRLTGPDRGGLMAVPAATRRKEEARAALPCTRGCAGPTETGSRRVVPQGLID